MFVLSKVMDVLTQPANGLLLVVLLGVGLLHTRRSGMGRAIVTAAALVMLLLAVLPWSEWLAGPLEGRFPPPATLPDHIDGIVVLGGCVDPKLTAARGQPILNGGAERLTAFADLARRHPEAKLVFTGGSGSMLEQELKEAPVARAVLAQMGVDVARVIFEDQSRNTWENAIMTKRLVNPAPGETWVLVTSAMHMPRSVGAFTAAEWPTLAYPVDYRTTGQGGGLRFNLSLDALDMAVHEWIGLAYYRLRGWSHSLYPSP